MDAASGPAQPDGRRECASALLAHGRILSLNASMAQALGTPPGDCVGRAFAELLPASQRTMADLLVRAATEGGSPTMRVLELPDAHGTTTACLIEAEPVEAPGDAEPHVRVQEVTTLNDPDSLLTPFRMAAKLGGLSLFLYLRGQRRFQWLGGAAPPRELAQTDLTPAHDVLARIDPADRAQLEPFGADGIIPADPVTCRFRSDHDGWHLLTARTRRVRLGFGGPERLILFVSDETEREAAKQEMLAALSTERLHAHQIGAFSSALIAATTEKELQQVILSRAAATFGGIGAVLALVDQGRLRVSSDAGTDPGLTKALDGMSVDAQDPLPYAIRTGEPQFISNRADLARRWPEADRLLRSTSAVALSVVPFTSVAGQPMGAWGVAYDTEHDPSSDERTLIATLADLTGQALGRVRLQQARMELANVLQQAMLPTLPSHLPGLEIAARYLPARDGLDVGGDWYDAFPTPDGAVMLAIGDAQGHDVDAAAFMGQVRTSLRAFASHEPGPNTLLARTNDLLVAMDAAKFASCTMLRFDPRDGGVTAASAGHVPLVWARADGDHGTREVPGGPVLGVLAGAEYDQERFRLDTDTALILVTDGVVEGPNMSLDTGLHRVGALAAQALREGLSTRETADLILSAATAVDHLDDAAVLVVRRA
jgi:GAF domain-containing protein